MRTAAEYRKQAEECRKLARQMAVPEDKEAFEQLAENWEKLAELRKDDLVAED